MILGDTKHMQKCVPYFTTLSVKVKKKKGNAVPVTGREVP
jgi:hypothetical protein